MTFNVVFQTTDCVGAQFLGPSQFVRVNSLGVSKSDVVVFVVVVMMMTMMARIW